MEPIVKEAVRRNLFSVQAVKPFVFLLCLLPLGHLLWGAVADALGPNPVERLLHATGDWTLRLLLVTLAATPLRRLTGWVWPIRLRRMLGLFAFFYALLHFGVYLWLDRALDWTAIVEDVVERPYITVGFAALLLLVPLAVTSTQGWQRRLGRRWKTLHRAVYPVAILGVVHYLWLVKADLREPLIHGLILLILLALRVPRRRPAKPDRTGPKPNQMD